MRARAGTDALRARLDNGLRRIAFFVVPSSMAFLALGDILAAALLQTGRFTLWRCRVRLGRARRIGGRTARLHARPPVTSTYYALRDTRTPLRYAVLRVALTTALGYVSALILPAALGIDARWGTAGLTASAGLAGWLEFALLRRSMNARIGRTGVPPSVLARLWIAAAISAAIAWGHPDRGYRACIRSCGPS